MNSPQEYGTVPTPVLGHNKPKTKENRHATEALARAEQLGAKHVRACEGKFGLHGRELVLGCYVIRWLLLAAGTLWSRNDWAWILLNADHGPTRSRKTVSRPQILRIINAGYRHASSRVVFWYWKLKRQGNGDWDEALCSRPLSSERMLCALTWAPGEGRVELQGAISRCLLATLKYKLLLGLRTILSNLFKLIDIEARRVPGNCMIGS